MTTTAKENLFGPIVVKFKPETETRQITATVPLSAYLRLQQLAARDQRSMSFVICQAIAGFLKTGGADGSPKDRAVAPNVGR